MRKLHPIKQTRSDVRATTLGLFTLGVLWTIISPPSAWAQNAVVAIGQVSNSGDLVASANTVGGVVTSAQNSTGHYTVTVTAPGAFAGAVDSDFLVETTVESASGNDEVPKAAIISVNADAVEIRVRTDDVEHSANTSAPAAQNRSFFFSLYRIPSAFPDPGATKYLFGLGKVASNGTLQSGLGVNGVTVTSSRIGTGNYLVTLGKPGAFIGDSVDDYVVILSIENAGTQDQTIRGDVTSVGSDDQIVINVHTDDSQDEVDDNNPVAEDESFFFTIYRIPPGGGAGLAASKLLVAMATVDGSSGNLITGGQSVDGGVLASTRNSEGDYRVTITSAGAFAGKTADQYVLQLHLNQGLSSDEFVGGAISLPDANTMHIDVNTNDLEQAGEAQGLAMDADFFLLVFDTEPAFRPDLRISRKRKLSLHEGDDVYNAGGAGQNIQVNLPSVRKKKYYLSLENDGNLIDDLFLKAKRSGSKLRIKYFRLTGGRQNITAEVTSGGMTESGVAPCKVIKYLAEARYKRSTNRPTKSLRYLTRSGFLPTRIDANKAKLLPK